jgi:UDP:flavonoid glycosyltransferase YjiC (YdhE family)
LIDFVANHFDWVFIPGDRGELPYAHLPQTQYTDPWLIRQASELPDRASARQLLNLPPNPATSVVVVAPGDGSGSYYGQLTQAIARHFPQVEVRCLATTCPADCPVELWASHWPTLDCLRAADIVVGPAEYGTFYECQALGIPLITLPLLQHYDRSLGRMESRQRQNCSEWPVISVHSFEGAIAAVERFLTQQCTQSWTYRNGVTDVFQTLQSPEACLVG